MEILKLTWLFLYPKRLTGLQDLTCGSGCEFEEAKQIIDLCVSDDVSSGHFCGQGYHAARDLPKDSIARQSFINVDAYQGTKSLTEAARDCGVELEVTGQGKNVRIDCPFACEGDHAGKREIAVDVTNPAKQWQCHAYGCPNRGNLLQLMYGLLTGEVPPAKLRGEAFRLVRDRIAEVTTGSVPSSRQSSASSSGASGGESRT